MSKKKEKGKAGKPKVVQDKVRIPGKTGGYVSDPEYGMGMSSAFTVSHLHRHPMASTEDEEQHPPEPESPDLAKGGAEEWIVLEAKERDAQRALLRPLSERVAALETVARRDQLRSLEKRVRQIERAMGKKAA